MKITSGRKSLARCLTIFVLSLAGNGLASHALAQSSSYRVAGKEQTVPSPSAERFVIVGGIRLHYVTSGSGRPVVMIHGNAGDVHDFEFGTLDLVAHNYQAIAFDLPGHGLSKMPRQAKGTVQEQATILHQALTALNISKPILVGHSWGAAIALAYALSYPQDISALVLLAPAAYSDHSHDAPAASLLRVPVLSDVCIIMLKPILGRWLLKQGLKEAFSPDPVPDAYLKSAAAGWLGRNQLKAFIKNDLMADSSLQKLSPHYQQIHTTVIIVTGDSDQAVSPQKNAFILHSAIANSELVVIPHTGHQIPETHPEAVMRAVDMAANDSRTIATDQND